MMSIIDEQFFRKENMTEEEFMYYFEIIENCKDINDSKFKVNGVGKCEILELHLKKIEPSIIELNGTVYIGKQNRCINGSIIEREKQTIVEIKVERLLVSEDKTYNTLDVFEKEDNKTFRTSYYNYKEPTTIEIENNKTKERLI